MITFLLLIIAIALLPIAIRVAFYLLVGAAIITIPLAILGVLVYITTHPVFK